jgi:GxxExxY protein
MAGMHSLFPRASQLTEQIINAAIEVHRHVGPGLLESIYEWCLVRELQLRGLEVAHQRKVTLTYKGSVREDILRCDLLVESAVLIELKAVEDVLPVHKAPLLSYMQLLDVPLGLLINFNRVRLVEGVSRLILRGADHSA